MATKEDFCYVSEELNRFTCLTCGKVVVAPDYKKYKLKNENPIVLHCDSYKCRVSNFDGYQYKDLEFPWANLVSELKKRAEVRCNHCNAIFLEPELDRHMIECPSKIRECNKCAFKGTLENLKDHLCGDINMLKKVVQDLRTEIAQLKRNLSKKTKVIKIRIPQYTLEYVGNIYFEDATDMSSVVIRDCTFTSNDNVNIIPDNFFSPTFISYPDKHIKLYVKGQKAGCLYTIEFEYY